MMKLNKKGYWTDFIEFYMVGLIFLLAIGFSLYFNHHLDDNCKKLSDNAKYSPLENESYESGYIRCCVDSGYYMNHVYVKNETCGFVNINETKKA